MDDESLIVTIFEAFKDLLVKLNLDDNIIGYTICLTLLCLIAAAKILTICLVLRKVKKCKTVSSLEEYRNDDLKQCRLLNICSLVVQYLFWCHLCGYLTHLECSIALKAIQLSQHTTA